MLSSPAVAGHLPEGPPLRPQAALPLHGQETRRPLAQDSLGPILQGLFPILRFVISEYPLKLKAIDKIVTT